jgi:hypothetical protein
MRYSPPALRRDYVRAGAGLGMTCLLLLLVTPLSIPFYVFLLLLGVFVAFAANTYLKQLTLIELDDDGVSHGFIGPVGVILHTQRISFDALDLLSLRYYGRRRDRGRGIVELTIGAAGVRFTADHALEDFDALVRKARAAARVRGVELSPSTEANLSSLSYH